MKLRKILAGFLAGAVAMTSMVVTSVTASAAEMVEVVINSDLPISIAVINTPGTYSVNDIEVVDTSYWSQINSDNNGTPTEYAAAFGTSTEAGYTGSVTLKADASIGTAYFYVYGWSNDDSSNIRYGSFGVDLSRVENGKVNVGVKADGEAGETIDGWYKEKPFTMEYITADTTVYETNSYAPTSIAGETDNCYLFEGTWDSSAVSGPGATLTIDAVSSGWGFHIMDLSGEVTLVENVWVNAGSTYSILLSQLDVSGGIQLITWGSFEFTGITIKNEAGKTVYTPKVPTIPVTIVDTEGGTVTLPDGTTEGEIEENGSITLIVTPDPGYQISGNYAVYGAHYDEDTHTISIETAVGEVSVEIYFEAIEAESVTLDRTTASILVGGTTTLVVTVSPADTLDQTITWSSSAPQVAEVDANGKVTGLMAGEATIYADCGDVSASCVVTVTEEEVPVESITLDASEITSYVGITTPVTVTVLPADATYESITWTSSDASVATVANGKVTAVAAGTATITASIGDISASLTITVIPEGYDKAEADFAADTIVAQKSYNMDGTTNARFVKMVSKTSIEDKNLVTFTLTSGSVTKTVESTSYYTALSASGTTVTAPDGYVFLAYTVTDIPEGVTVTCTDIAVSKK